MKDRVFVDTNILVYSLSDCRKAKIAQQIIGKKNDLVLSVQVINEFFSVMTRKQKCKRIDVIDWAQNFMTICDCMAMTQETVMKSYYVMEKINISNWDALIIASALESDCSILYSEDMQDGHVIEGKLTIVNPFK